MISEVPLQHQYPLWDAGEEIFYGTLTLICLGCAPDRARLERQDPAESEDTQAPLVHLVSKVYLELLERRVER